MTNDYKKYLLDYLTDIQPGNPTYAEIINSTKEIARNIWIPFLPSQWTNFKLNGALKSTTSDKVVFYGEYVESPGTYQNNSRGLIIITDSDLNPIQAIYEFASGTKLRPILCMVQEEDGQFVAVDSTIMYYTIQEVKQAYYSCEKRFIMLNDVSNPTNNSYQVNLRTSYILPNTNFTCKDIYKNPSSSHYLMTGTAQDTTSYSPRFVKVVDLKINVGSANEWRQVATSNQFIYGGSYCYFDSSDNANWKILISPNSTSDNTIRYWYGTNGTATDSAVIFTPSYKTYIDESSYECQSVFINENLVYFTTNNQHWGNSGVLRPKYLGLYEYNFSTNKLREIFIDFLGNYDWSYLDLINLYSVNGELYIAYYTNVDNVNFKANYYVQRFKGEWKPILIKEGVPFRTEYRAFYVSQTFNVLKMYCLPINPQIQNWEMLGITEIYNLANYNGEPYEDYNSLVPKYANIYSNNEVIFSRNLHNLTITNNYSVASVEVPNTYLNDVALTLKELVGETNTTLIQDGRTVVKNIYEVLYLNYINTLKVKDNDNNFLKNVSMYINTNVNTGTQTNHNNSKCAKVCINYSDSTNKIFPIGWMQIDNTHKYTKFSIYVDKQIDSIELISNDQTTTYLTIIRELEIGKYYTFKQYLKIE